MAVYCQTVTYYWLSNSLPKQKRYRPLLTTKGKFVPDLFDRNHWPEVLRAIQEAGQRNFTIFHKDDLLFGYFEYAGDDFEADMKKLSEKPIIKKWLTLTDPCQEPLETRKPGEWWAYMEEIYHND